MDVGESVAVFVAEAVALNVLDGIVVGNKVWVGGLVCVRDNVLVARKLELDVLDGGGVMVGEDLFAGDPSRAGVCVKLFVCFELIVFEGIKASGRVVDKRTEVIETGNKVPVLGLGGAEADGEPYMRP